MRKFLQVLGGGGVPDARGDAPHHIGARWCSRLRRRRRYRLLRLRLRLQRTSRMPLHADGPTPMPWSRRGAAPHAHRLLERVSHKTNGIGDGWSRPLGVVHTRLDRLVAQTAREATAGFGHLWDSSLRRPGENSLERWIPHLGRGALSAQVGSPACPYCPRPLSLPSGRPSSPTSGGTARRRPWSLPMRPSPTTSSPTAYRPWSGCSDRRAGWSWSRRPTPLTLSWLTWPRSPPAARCCSRRRRRSGPSRRRTTRTCCSRRTPAGARRSAVRAARTRCTRTSPCC
jgi:hypothetical protein